MTVGQSKAKIYGEKDMKITFADVAGVDEAKEELREVIEFLKTPENSPPRRKDSQRDLIRRPAGNRQDSLARAVAGEAG